MYFLSIIVLCFLFLETFGRPTHDVQDYKESKENSYRDSDSDETDDYQHDDGKSSLKQFAGEPAPKSELDENLPGTNEEIDHENPDKDYLENEESDAALSHDDVSNDVKRTATYRNVLLFHDEKPQKIETKEYNEDKRVKPSHIDRYSKQYHPIHNLDRDGLIRHRRQIKNNNLPIGTAEISSQKNGLSTTEDEETAIRTHVKKLSKEELDELLQSLSEEKRALLKNIIDNSQQENDSINKREITKKAGANEENNFVGNEQSDISKIQGGSANLDVESSIAPIIEKQDSSKKTDTESMTIDNKSSETPNSSEKSNDKINEPDNIEDKSLVKSENIENFQSSDADSKISGNPESEKEKQKKENKREIDSNASESIVEVPDLLKTSNKEDLYCSDNEALSQLRNEESSLFNDNNKYKREVCSDSIDAMNTLEESFPNTDSINNFKIGSDMAPLVRVKRDGSKKKVDKRYENVVSNLKVPYFSSALENNEEERNEGGEFQDDGFYDRGANYAKSNELSKRGTDTSKGSGKNFRYCSNSQSFNMDKNKLETDTAGLGSDTDVVLSGIEGVDDNMMYNSIARIRRSGNTIYNANIEDETGKLSQENNQEFILNNENNEISEENNNAASYQENDSFGSLPRNYEQGQSRFKRIRRLKSESNAPVVK